ncbi:MAG: M2 family metallopeptidase, partial [Myxococcota bacterium]|nr:M2 family metallopeptidase [Myxococcota bacterium]
ATASAPGEGAPTTAEAGAFIDDVEEHLHRLWASRDQASWVNENFITNDTEALSAAGEEATAAYVGEVIKRSKRYAPLRDDLPADVARKLYLLSIAQTVPAPRDAKMRVELAGIEAWMTSAYGKGQYCPPVGSGLIDYVKSEKGMQAAVCLHLDEMSRVLRTSHKPEELIESWRGWHAIAAPLKAKFVRYVDLADQGAREIGFSDVGALWRTGYDMSPDAFELDVERLWAEVKPLYDALHCYVRAKLRAKYGSDKVPDHAPIPAHLLGNMWAQEWNNIYDIVAPFPTEPALDVGRKLKSDHWDAMKMVRQGERFFTALGFDPLPPTFWERSLLTRPRDRDVVCHASAWDVTWNGDLRIKMCIEPTEEDFVTIHHELGHLFYFQRYGHLPILFQQGANDGFHEAIGDTMALSVTPEYLKTIGLLDTPQIGDRMRINQQMKMALAKVAFLPFGLLIDKWRWEVFSGKVTPADYNAAWWRLKEQYQGISAPLPRSAEDFDPGAKFHVASSTPYVRYFLARVYQFQFHKALCEAAGHASPLDRCSIHDNKSAGTKLMGMLSLGASKAWPDALEAVGAGRRADARPMLEYFAPLIKWLADQNKGQRCGW